MAVPRTRKAKEPSTYYTASGVQTDSGLRPEQEAYCRARAMGMSPKEAVKAAGLSIKPVTALNWETKYPQVAARIVFLMQMATTNAIVKTGLDREWVISRLMTIADRCMQAEPVVDRKGNPVQVETPEGGLANAYTFDSAGANRALELLGKTLRMWDGKGESPENDYANLSDEDLAALAAELAASTGVAARIAGNQTPAGSKQAIELHPVPKAG